MYAKAIKELFISGNKESQQRTYWAESLLESIPPLDGHEIVAFIERVKLHGPKEIDERESKKCNRFL